MDRTVFRTMMGAAASPRVSGQQEWTTPGTFSWLCPTDGSVTSICIVAIGAAWGNGRTAGAGLGWYNNFAVTPGQSYTVRVGAPGGANGDSYFHQITLVAGKAPTSSVGGTFVGQGGGNGGDEGTGGAGGGGCGGYSGKGGNGGTYGTGGTGGTGGGGGGGGGGLESADETPGTGTRYKDYACGAGGGCDIYGQGTNGTGGGGGAIGVGIGGQGGSGGSSGATPASATGTGGTGGRFGGGPGGSFTDYFISVSGETTLISRAPAAAAAGGAVRIIWGAGRAFPSTRTANE